VEGVTVDGVGLVDDDWVVADGAADWARDGAAGVGLVTVPGGMADCMGGETAGAAVGGMVVNADGAAGMDEVTVGCSMEVEVVGNAGVSGGESKSWGKAGSKEFWTCVGESGSSERLLGLGEAIELSSEESSWEVGKLPGMSEAVRFGDGSMLLGRAEGVAKQAERWMRAVSELGGRPLLFLGEHPFPLLI
jgi:hypothetical protein